MSAPSFDIKDMLLADVTVDTTNYPIEIGVNPANLSKSIAIVDVPGGSPQLTMDKAKYERPSVQIKVQTSNYSEGIDLAYAIKDSLHGRANETWNGSYYALITCLTEPGFHERVEQRTIFVINFNVQRR